MSNWRRLAGMIRLRVTDHRVIRACNYLEARGNKFCVDFGVENAVECARQDWRTRRGGASA
jgi:hypothetical protein